MIRVSAGICSDQGYIWIFKRGAGRKNAHLWEFPGGKEEAGEDPAACLVRELREELSLAVTPPTVLCEDEAQGLHFTFLCCEAQNTPVLTEHEEAALVAPRELLHYDFCPADAPVARRLALSEPPVTELFWDLDGTLIDTYPSMVAAFLRAAESLGFHAEEGRVLALMKDRLGVCVAAYAAEQGIPEDTLLAAFRREEVLTSPALIRPVDGVPEALAILRGRGCRHYLVTHRDASALRYLRLCGLDGFFEDRVIGTDGFARKPAPDSLLWLMGRHGLERSACMMIGDRPLDVQAARNAGVLGCLLDGEGRFADCTCEVRIRGVGELTEACARGRELPRE